MQTCGLELHPVKTKMVYCRDSIRRGESEHISFDFPGYTFMPRMVQNSIRKAWLTSWLPAVSRKAMKSMNEKMKELRVFRTSSCTLTHLAATINPVLRGWINYYGKFYRANLKTLCTI